MNFIPIFIKVNDVNFTITVSAPYLWIACAEKRHLQRIYCNFTPHQLLILHPRCKIKKTNLKNFRTARLNNEYF